MIKLTFLKETIMMSVNLNDITILNINGADHH